MDAAENQPPDAAPQYRLRRGQELLDWLDADPAREQKFIELWTQVANGELFADKPDMQAQARALLTVHFALRASQRKKAAADRQLAEANQALLAHQTIVDKQNAIVAVLSDPAVELTPVERRQQAQRYFNDLTDALLEIPEAQRAADVQKLLPDWEKLRAILFFESRKPT